MERTPEKFETLGIQTNGVDFSIPQVDVAGMSDKKKAQIPLASRSSSPTTAEARLNALAARGPDCMDDPEYWEAWHEVERERGNEQP